MHNQTHAGTALGVPQAELRRQAVERIARSFCRRLLAELGEERMADVRRKQYLPAYDGCCATHDHCDANMVMLAAVAEATGVPEDEHDFSCQATCDLCNDAWTAARLAEYREEAVKW